MIVFDMHVAKCVKRHVKRACSSVLFSITSHKRAVMWAIDQGMRLRLRTVDVGHVHGCRLRCKIGLSTNQGTSPSGPAPGIQIVVLQSVVFPELQ
jgi:class 3 adenylate cyclase